MKKIRQLFILLGIFTVGDMLGQEEHIDNYFMTLDVALKYGNYRSDAIGTPYINETFEPAAISIDDKIYAVRYNAVHDEMEIQIKNEKYYLLKTVGLKVKLKKIQKLYQTFPLPDDASKNGFFVVLAEGNKATLLSKEHIRYFDKVEPSTGYDSPKPAQFKRVKDSYYLSFDGKSTRNLPSKKKKFLKLFNDSSRMIESYMKKEKLGIKKSEDLYLIFEYYNSL